MFAQNGQKGLEMAENGTKAHKEPSTALFLHNFYVSEWTLRDKKKEEESPGPLFPKKKKNPVRGCARHFFSVQHEKKILRQGGPLKLTKN